MQMIYIELAQARIEIILSSLRVTTTSFHLLQTWNLWHCKKIWKTFYFFSGLKLNE